MPATPCRLIVDPPQRGSWNMAVDEWLLRRAAETGQLTLRFYEWAEPTLSLGYFQAYGDRQSHAASLDLPLVRRASGGGALVHHHELTYSLAVPPGHPLATRAQDLYDAAHRSLVEVLATTVQPTLGEFGRAGKTESRGTGEPFLCFSRRAQGDVIFAQTAETTSHALARCDKICGSAQRRQRGAVLQHGGVLLAGSPHAPELKGIREVAEQEITARDLREHWIGPMTDQLGLTLARGETLTAGDCGEIEAIELGRFADRGWTRRR